MSALPYTPTPGNIDKALLGIRSAQVPERVSQDFVKAILKIPGGSGDRMTTYLKQLGFAKADGAPTQLYTRFRNPTSSGAAVAAAIRHAYAPLYVRNEYMHQLSDDELTGLVVEETGNAPDSGAVKLTVSCIKRLKAYAKFEHPKESDNTGPLLDAPKPTSDVRPESHPANGVPTGRLALNLGYTINLNLPATSDQAVFNAIFKSLKENLLREDDA